MVFLENGCLLAVLDTYKNIVHYYRKYAFLFAVVILLYGRSSMVVPVGWQTLVVWPRTMSFSNRQHLLAGKVHSISSHLSLMV